MLLLALLIYLVQLFVIFSAKKANSSSCLANPQQRSVTEISAVLDGLHGCTMTAEAANGARRDAPNGINIMPACCKHADTATSSTIKPPRPLHWRGQAANRGNIRKNQWCKCSHHQSPACSHPSIPTCFSFSWYWNDFSQPGGNT